MKRIIKIFIPVLLSASQLLGQEKLSNLENFSFYPEMFAGASAMIGVSYPFVSYGLGGRVYYVNPKVKYLNKDYGTFAELEWNHRGGWDGGWSNFPGEEEGPHGLDYLDMSFGIRWGNNFFMASGLTFGALVSKGSGVDWPEDMKSLDLGSIFILGYFFGNEKKTFLSFDTKYSFINAYNNTDYFFPSNNITWGFVFGVKI